MQRGKGRVETVAAAGMKRRKSVEEVEGNKFNIENAKGNLNFFFLMKEKKNIRYRCKCTF